MKRYNWAISGAKPQSMGPMLFWGDHPPPNAAVHCSTMSRQPWEVWVEMANPACWFDMGYGILFYSTAWVYARQLIRCQKDRGLAGGLCICWAFWVLQVCNLKTQKDQSGTGRFSERGMEWKLAWSATAYLSWTESAIWRLTNCRPPKGNICHRLC